MNDTLIALFESATRGGTELQAELDRREGNEPATRRAFVSVRTHCIRSLTGAEARAHDAGMEATTKLQKAGRAFLPLVAAYGPLEAVRMLRALTT